MTADGNLGVYTFVDHVSGTLDGGTEISMWVRGTLCCRRTEGRWLIIHDHESVPFDPSSGQALIDLAL